MALDLANMDPNARRLFLALQNQWGSDLPVTSAYRSPAHNALVGGAKNSHHMRGDAFDLDTSAMSEAERARLIRMASGGGFGGYDGSLHMDTGATRRWGPDHTSGSTPDWLNEALGDDMASPNMRRPIQTARLGAPGQTRH